MPDLKPIETRYKGYRFRSRLEARWAVFFDALDIKWEYEPEGYRLSSGDLYLPDFWLPEFRGTASWESGPGTWAEIKPSDGSWEKARQLCLDSRKPVWLCEGVPDIRAWKVLNAVDFCDECGGMKEVWEYPPEPRPPCGSQPNCCGGWKPCSTCNQTGRAALHVVEQLGTPFIEKAAREHRMWWEWGEDLSNSEVFRIVADFNHDPAPFYRAVEAARGARFEHGETPHVRP